MKLSAFVADEVPHDARWVVMRTQGRRFGIFMQEEDVFNSEGNAFLFAEKPGEGARIMVIHSGAFFTVKAEKEDPVPQRNERQEYRAVWKNADVTRDVTAAAEWLGKEAAKAKLAGSNASPSTGDPFGSSVRRIGQEGSSQFALHQQTALLWAALLMHTGHEAEALKLGRLAFGDTSEERRKDLLDGLFNRMAAPALQAVMRAFWEKHDWARLRDGLDALVNNFPHGWQQRDAVRVFQQKVAERAKLPTEPPLKTKPPLGDADQKLLLAWLKELEGGKSPSYNFWTLPPLPGAEPAERGQNTTAFPGSHGLMAVPLLAALLSDDTMTTIGADRFGGGGFYSGSDADAVEKLRNAYRSLQKPPTRAEIAWQILEHVLPNELRSGNEADVASLAPDVLAWYKSVKDSSPADLALAYLESGARDDETLGHAMTHTEPKKMTRLENAMLENVNIFNLAEMEPFVEKLGERAPPFLAKLRQRIEGEVSRFEVSDEQPRKMMEAGMKRLDAVAKGEVKKPDLLAMIAAMAKFDPEAPEEDQLEARAMFDELPKQLKKLSIAARMEAIIPKLPDFKSPVMAGYLLGALGLNDDVSFEKMKPEERRALLERTKSDWQRLLDWKPDPGLERQPSGLLLQTIGALQNLAGGSDDPALHYLGTLGTHGEKALRDHGTALIAGRKPAPLPQVMAIPSEKRKQMLAEWSGKSAEEISKGIETLELEKLIALNEALAREPELPANLKSYINQVREVTATDVADAASWQSLRGRVMDKATVIDLARRVSTIESDVAVSVNAQRAIPLFGWKLKVKEEARLPNGWQGQRMKSVAENIGEQLPKLAKRVAMGFFQRGRSGANWMWFDVPVTEEPKEDASKPKQPTEELSAAWESMQEARGDELQSWQTIFRAIEQQQQPEPTSLFFFSAPVAILTPPKSK